MKVPTAQYFTKNDRFQLRKSLNVIPAKEEQFIRVEAGEGRVLMGKTKDNLTFDKKVSDDWAIFIPAGYWHNIVNTGKNPLKVYVLYSPPEHPAGTIHKTFEEAEADHDHK